MEDSLNVARKVRPVVAALVWRAEQHAADGELAHAESFFRAAIAADLTSVALSAYGIYLADTEREGEALVEFTRAAELARRNEDWELLALVCHNMAAVYRRLGNPLLSQQQMQQAIAAWLHGDIGGELPHWLLVGWAETALLSGELEAAEQLLAPAAEAEETQVAGLADLAVAAWAQGDASRGLSLAARAFELAGDDPGTTADRGRLAENVAHMLQMRGRIRDAARCFEIAADLHGRAGRPKARWSANRCRQVIRRALASLEADPLRN